MIGKQLDIVIEKIRQLPQERQNAALEALEVIAAQENGDLSGDEIEDIREAQQAVHRGELAPDEDVQSFFARFRA